MNHTSLAYGQIVGLVASVPARVITNADCPDPAAADEAAKITGVRERRWVREGQTSADLCTAAARRLLDGLGWSGESLDLIVYVTQTPSRAVPADVYSIAAELGAHCPCVQPNYSCSGYVYGLWLTMRLLDAGQRALLLVGDATSTIADPDDRATAPLFGDAGSATAVYGGDNALYVDRCETRKSVPLHFFAMGTDGAGAEKLCVVDRVGPRDSDGYLTDVLRMDGAAVFNFTLKRVPPMAEALRRTREPDVWALHQANAMIMSHLARKCAIPADKMPTNIARFGNTSAASIPLLMADTMGEQLTSQHVHIGMLGYGAGLAWAGANLHATPMQVCELIEVECELEEED